MRFACRPVDASFFERAPTIHRIELDLPASAERVFSVLEDGEAWTRWFPEIQRVTWTSPSPLGIGTTRTVALTSITVDEYFFEWEPGRRFSFYFTQATRPLARSFAESYRLSPTGPQTCRFTWVIAYQLRFPFFLAGALVRARFEKMFRNAAAGLARYLS